MEPDTAPPRLRGNSRHVQQVASLVHPTLAMACYLNLMGHRMCAEINPTGNRNPIRRRG